MWWNAGKFGEVEIVISIKVLWPPDLFNISTVGNWESFSLFKSRCCVFSGISNSSSSRSTARWRSSLTAFKALPRLSCWISDYLVKMSFWDGASVTLKYLPGWTTLIFLRDMIHVRWRLFSSSSVFCVTFILLETSQFLIKLSLISANAAPRELMNFIMWAVIFL